MDKPTRRGFLGRLAGIVAAGVVAPKVAEVSKPGLKGYAAPQNISNLTDAGDFPTYRNSIWMNSRQADQYLAFTKLGPPRSLTEDMLINAFDDIKRRR